MLPPLVDVTNNWTSHIEVPVYGGRYRRLPARATRSLRLAIPNHPKVLGWLRVGLLSLVSGPVAPPGFVLLLGADGAQLLGADGAPLYGVA